MNITKKIIGALFATAVLIVPVVSFAATLNGDAQDYATLRVANNTTNSVGCTTCWSSTANASQGDRVSFAIYYHNSGSDTATNVHVRLTPQSTGNGSTQTFTATVSADNAPSVTGTATVYLSSSQSLSYNGTTYWYPYNSNPTSAASLLNGQTGAELFNGVGLNLGNIAPGWTTQGSVTASYTVSSTQTNNGTTPFVSTNSATGITQTSATLNGTVTPNGPSETSWFEWGTTQSFGTTVQTGNQGSGTNNVSITAGLWNLSPNTTYYFRAVAQNAQGISYGSTLNFVTGYSNSQSTLPTITTNSATNVSQYNATLNGYVNPNGTSDTSRWFEWGTSYSNLGTDTTHYLHGTNPDGFSTVLSGLSPNTTYYFQAVAQNSQGIVQGQILSFYTSGNGCSNNCNNGNESEPSVTTQDATNLSNNYVTLNGYVDPNGTSDTTRWFEWGSNSASNMYSETTHYNQGGSAGSFSESLPNLSENTTYYYRAVAQNGQGIVYGNTVSFVAGNNCNGGGGYLYGTCGNGYGSNIASIETRTADTSSTFVVLNGYADPNGGGDTTHWFEWGSTYSLGQTTPFVSQGYSPSAFTATLSGLIPNTTYYYRAVARNNNGTAYGSILSFTSIVSNGYNGYNGTGAAPTVTTLLPTNVTSSSAVLNGLVFTSNNVSSNAWFEWGADSSMTTRTQTYAVGVLPVVRYSDTINGLNNGQTYYYRIVAQNTYGTVYGSTQTFVSGNSTITDNNTTTVVNTPVQTTRTVTVVNRTTGTDSLVSLTIDGGDEAIFSGDKRVYHVTWQNQSTQTLQNVVLRVMFPQGINVDSATKGTFSNTDNSVAVDISTLAPGDKGETFIFATAGDSLNVGQLLVVTANMVYTKTNGIQGDAIAYVTHRVGTQGSTSGLGASIFGSGAFLPTTLLGWMILIILLLGLVLLGNHVYGRFGKDK